MAEAEGSLAVDPQVEEVNDTDDEGIWPLQEVKRRIYFPHPVVLFSGQTVWAGWFEGGVSKVLVTVPTATEAHFAELKKLQPRFG